MLYCLCLRAKGTCLCPYMVRTASITDVVLRISSRIKPIPVDFNKKTPLALSTSIKSTHLITVTSFLTFQPAFSLALRFNTGQHLPKLIRRAKALAFVLIFPGRLPTNRAAMAVGCQHTWPWGLHVAKVQGYVACRLLTYRATRPWRLPYRTTRGCHHTGHAGLWGL